MFYKKNVLPKKKLSKKLFQDHTNFCLKWFWSKVRRNSCFQLYFGSKKGLGPNKKFGWNIESNFEQQKNSVQRKYSQTILGIENPLDKFQTSSRHLPVTSQTPSRRLPSQTPFKHLPLQNNFYSPSWHPPDGKILKSMPIRPALS